MRILGIDPGLNTTGFGIVDVDGHALRYVASGTISTRSVTSGSLPQRLKVLFDGIAEITERYRPDSSAVEIVFVNVNPQSTLLLGTARVADGLLGSEEHRAAVARAAAEGPLVYLPHRREHAAEVAAIRGIPGVSVIEPGLPVELFLAGLDGLEVRSSGSSADTTLAKVLEVAR